MGEEKQGESKGKKKAIPSKSEHVEETIGKPSHFHGPVASVTAGISLLEISSENLAETSGGSSNDDGLSGVKGLSDRTEESPAAAQVPKEITRNTFLGWVKDMVAVGERGAEADDLSAVDTIGASEDEANYSADSEGVWLLACIGGLLLFSCVMVCVIKTCSSWYCIAAKTIPTTFTDCVNADVCKDEVDVDKDAVHHAGEEAVPTFEAVINRVREQVVDNAHTPRIDELLSAVAGMPADKPSTKTSTPVVKGFTDSAHCGSRSRVCEQVKFIPALTEDVLAQLEGTQAGYDCVLARPLSFCQVMRFQATVLQQDTDITAPLALQTCVLYQVTVSRRLHSGMPPVPLAFSSMNSSFQVAPNKRPDLRVAVEGSDVMLFDMLDGRFTYNSAFAGAPGHLQDYVLTHRSTVPSGQLQTSSALRTDATPLEFQECALLVGSKITLVGELVRDAGGDVVLKPAYLSLPELNGSSRVLVLRLGLGQMWK
jgi:hypothetical protein